MSLKTPDPFEKPNTPVTNLPDLKTRLKKKYEIDNATTQRLHAPLECFDRLKILSRIFGGHPHDFSSLKDKRILDLACGSMDRTDAFGYQNCQAFEPWFCRSLFEIGASPVGIDIRAQENEEFEWYQRDLRDHQALAMLPPASFDAINMTRLFDCRFDNSPTLNGICPPHQIPFLRQHIFKEAARLLKQEGHFLKDEEKHILRNHQFHRFPLHSV